MVQSWLVSHRMRQGYNHPRKDALRAKRRKRSRECGAPSCGANEVGATSCTVEYKV